MLMLLVSVSHLKVARILMVFKDEIFSVDILELIKEELGTSNLAERD